MIKTAKHLEKYTTNASPLTTFNIWKLEHKRKVIFTFSPMLIKEHSFLFPFFCISFYAFATIKVSHSGFTDSDVSTVAGVVGELWVGAAIGRRVPDVQVHVRPERVEAGELVGPGAPLRLPAEWGVRRGDGGDGGHGRHRGGSLGWEVVLWGPDGAEQAGHGREAAGPREIWLWGIKKKDF